MCAFRAVIVFLIFGHTQSVFYLHLLVYKHIILLPCSGAVILCSVYYPLHGNLLYYAIILGGETTRGGGIVHVLSARTVISGDCKTGSMMQ